MKVRLAPRHAKPQRGGFTLIELLVVISIIAVLASLILPGVQNAREAARRITCFNNMRNVGLAVAGYTASNNGAFPPLSGGGDSYQLNADGTVGWGPAPWTVHLLPYLEQQGLYDRLTTKQTSAPTAAAIESLQNVAIKVLTCPDDLTADQPGAFSFAANAGFIGQDDWSAAETDVGHRISRYRWVATSGETGVTENEYYKRGISTGIFWREDSPYLRDLQSDAGPTMNWRFNGTQLKMTMDRVRDGTSQTLLLTENMNNGGWLPTSRAGGITGATLGASTGDLAFGIRTPGASNSPSAGLFTPTWELNGTGADGIGSAGFRMSATADQVSRINANLTAATGSAPRPSSYHPQIVNVIFCDGHGQTLNQSIDDSVYARLLTPNGNAYNASILSGNSF